MSTRRARLSHCVLSLVATVGTGSGAATPHMPISEIRPGMVGVGHTVFNGTKVEEFRAQHARRHRERHGPAANLILAKLEGGPLADTGVIAGMSGSPVYIDGRLIGAVSYSLGSFSKEPIAGITPIDEMTERPRSTRRVRRRRAVRSRVSAHARSLDGGVSQSAQLESSIRRPSRRCALLGRRVRRRLRRW